MLASRLLSLATRAFLSGLFRSKYIDSAQAYWVALEKKKKERRQGKSSELTQLSICCKHKLQLKLNNLPEYSVSPLTLISEFDEVVHESGRTGCSSWL